MANVVFKNEKRDVAAKLINEYDHENPEVTVYEHAYVCPKSKKIVVGFHAKSAPNKTVAVGYSYDQKLGLFTVIGASIDNLISQLSSALYLHIVRPIRRLKSGARPVFE